MRPELAGFKTAIEQMFKLYKDTVAAVNEVKEQQYLDFIARRLVEMAGDLVMSSLLLLDANRSPELFTKSLEVYVKMAQADVIKHFDYISNFKPEQIDAFKA